MDSTFEGCIGTVQEMSGPEISIMFYNGSQDIKDGALIDRLVQDHFVEYLSQDLSTFQKPLT